MAAQQRDQAKARLGLQREESRKGMGLEALKLGGTFAARDFSNTPLLGGLFGNKGTAPTSTRIDPSGATQYTGKSEGFFGKLNTGGMLQGGLAGGMAGFGLANMFGSGKKKQKMLGAGLGLLGGALLGSNALSTGGGFLGSLFGGK